MQFLKLVCLEFRALAQPSASQPQLIGNMEQAACLSFITNIINQPEIPSCLIGGFFFHPVFQSSVVLEQERKSRG